MGIEPFLKNFFEEIGNSINGYTKGLMITAKTLACCRYLRILLAIVIFSVGIVSLLSLYTHISPLSGFFLMITGLCDIAVSIFALHYFKSEASDKHAKILLFETIFILAIALVFLANNPILFLFAWEIMTLSSYFLIVSINPNKQTRRAGLLYLGIAHIAFFAIVMSFYLLFFQNHITPAALQWIFIFAFIGFGAKAGLFPLHIWLPEAHPAAPSPISALMSGVMLNTAIYALFKFCFIFLSPVLYSQWGYACVTIGLITMLLGVIYAAIETDLKRLLAYSSMENMGLIVTALGLAILFKIYHHPVLSEGALLVVFLHTLNHSVFKTLLFLGTGSIIKQTHTTQLKNLGGLNRAMPFVSICVLIGSLSLAGLPFFNGFYSEWLYLNLFFHHPVYHSFLFSILSPIMVGVSVLVFGLAGIVMIKSYGLTFLGQSRHVTISKNNSTWPERISFIWLSAWCVLLGIWPYHVMMWINHFLQQSMAEHVLLHGYHPIYLLLLFSFLLLLAWIFLKQVSPKYIRKKMTWNCGWHEVTSRMQDSATGFSQPIRQIFSNVLWLKTHIPNPNDSNPRYIETTREKTWVILYSPLIRLFMRLGQITRWFQQGNISTYLLYIGITVFILFVLVISL